MSVLQTFIRSSVRQFKHPNIHLISSVRPSIPSSIYKLFTSIHPSVSLTIRTSILSLYPSIHPSIAQFLPSIHFITLYPNVYPFIHLHICSIHPSIRKSVHPFKEKHPSICSSKLLYITSHIPLSIPLSVHLSVTPPQTVP